MPPATIQLVLFALEEAIKLEPSIQVALTDLFSKPDPKPEDWEALRARVGGKSYRDFVPATALPAGE
jgi:hypothetical protein